MVRFMYLQTKDVSLYAKVTNRLKTGRSYRGYENEMAGLQLQQFTVQKAAQEHSKSNKEEILARAKALDIPTVILWQDGMQFIGQSGISTQEILTEQQVEKLNEHNESRWTSARWHVHSYPQAQEVLDFNCNYDISLVLAEDTGFFVNGVRIKNRHQQIEHLWNYGYPSKRGRPLRIGNLGHSGSKDEIKHLVRWVENLKSTRTQSEVALKVMSIYNSLNRHYAWPEHW